MQTRLRLAVRRLVASPVVALVAMASLAIGISGTTSIFTLVNALMLRPLPVEAPTELVRVGSMREGEGFYAFSYPDYVLLRDTNRVFSGLVAHQPIQLSWRRETQAQLGWAEIVSGNYFDVLGVAMVAGRAFRPEEDRTPGTHPVVVISHSLWQRRLAGDPSVVGSAITINGHAFIILGVTPPSFRGTFTGFAIDMWVPAMSQPLTMPGTNDRIDRRDAMFLMLISPASRRRPWPCSSRSAIAGIASRCLRTTEAAHIPPGSPTTWSTRSTSTCFESHSFADAASPIATIEPRRQP